MTLFSSPRATKGLILSIALAASGMTVAQAGEGETTRGWSDAQPSGRMIARQDRHGRDDWRPRERRKFDERRAERHGGHRYSKDRNFYGGGFTAYRDPGNGTYFHFDDDSTSESFYGPLAENRGPKIIEIVPGSDGCSWELGVCVIRP